MYIYTERERENIRSQVHPQFSNVFVTCMGKWLKYGRKLEFSTNMWK